MYLSTTVRLPRNGSFANEMDINFDYVAVVLKEGSIKTCEGQLV